MIKNRILFIQFSIVIMLFVCCRQQPVFSQKNNAYDLVKDFNARGDNKTDNYAAFVQAAAEISKAGGGVLNIPKGQYYIAAYKVLDGKNKNAIADIIFKDCKNLSIIGNNSTIRVNGKFLRSRDYQVPGSSYNYAYNNTVCPLKLVNCKNVLIKDISLYGEVDKMTKQEGVVEGESFGIYIADDEPGQQSSRIVLLQVEARFFASDGFIIKSNGEDILLNECRSYKNARQGLSIVKGKNIRVLNSEFDSTGITGAYGWHGPAAGIDIENEFGLGKLSGVTVRNCHLRGNYGFQIVTNLSSDHVLIDSCFIADKTGGYSRELNGVGMYSLNSTLSNNIIFGNVVVDLSDQRYNGPIEQEINKNIIYSGNRGILSADFNRPVNITDNILVMLPRPHLNDYFPYIQNANARFNRNIIAVHADRLKQTPNQVTALIQNLKEAKDDFWLTNGYDIPMEKRKSVYYIPAANGTKDLQNQMFQQSDIITRYSLKPHQALTMEQVNTILAAGLFTAYRQEKFQPKYLLQADAVRNYARSIVASIKQ